MVLYKVQDMVLILPMRNGNIDNVFTASNISLRSYPTYEEWKHSNSNSNNNIDRSYPTYEEWKLLRY